jgi:uridylate kinase
VANEGEFLMDTDTPLVYTRVVIKISGESLGADGPLDPDRMMEFARTITDLHNQSILMLIIMGGGNLFRGNQAQRWHMDRPNADAAGMIATGLNAQLLHGILANLGVPSEIFSCGPCRGIGREYQRDEVKEAFDLGLVTLIAGGIGVSGVSTDMAALSTAIDIGANAVIMSKYGVNGVYDSDPRQNPHAEFLPSITATDALAKSLAIMDMAALGLAREHDKIIHVVGADDPENIKHIIEGKELGSTVLPA